MGNVIPLPTYRPQAVLSCPTGDQWHVTTHSTAGNVVLHRVFYNPHHACDLLTVLGRDGDHAVIVAPSAERWRGLMNHSRFDSFGGAA